MKSKLIRSALVSALGLLLVTTALRTTVVVNDDVSNELNEELEVSISENSVDIVSTGMSNTVTDEFVEELAEPLIELGVTIQEMPIAKFEEMDTVMYTISCVNIRKTPSIDAEIVGEFTVHDSVHVLGKYEDEWYKIEYNDSFAYVHSDYLTSNYGQAIKVMATAYYNPNGNKTADGSNTIVNLTLAGKRAWFGKGCHLYRCNADGSKGAYMGYYEFHDTGWGLGQIPRGETIDIYMETYDECMTWGRHNVWIEFVD